MDFLGYEGRGGGVSLSEFGKLLKIQDPNEPRKIPWLVGLFGGLYYAVI